MWLPGSLLPGWQKGWEKCHRGDWSDEQDKHQGMYSDHWGKIPLPLLFLLCYNSFLFFRPWSTTTSTLWEALLSASLSVSFWSSGLPALWRGRSSLRRHSGHWTERTWQTIDGHQISTSVAFIVVAFLVIVTPQSRTEFKIKQNVKKAYLSLTKWRHNSAVYWH